MPWRDTFADDERLQFIVETFEGLSSVADLCRSFGVSRKTGYKWLGRFDAEGPAGLSDRSRKPHSHPQAVPAAVVEHVLAVRRDHPRWGPRKILAFLGRCAPTLALPAVSTVGTVLKRHGLVRLLRLFTKR